MPGYYEIPYRDRVIHGDPSDIRGRFIIDPTTGEVQKDTAPKNLLVIDAYELRKLKLRIREEVARDVEPRLRANKKLNRHFTYAREEFKRLEKALFPKPPPSTP